MREFEHCHEASETDELTLDNCSGCALSGRGALETGPNYAGWARLYVETQTPIPSQWLAAFARHAEKDTLYADCLREAISAYGVTFSGGGYWAGEDYLVTYNRKPRVDLGRIE